MNSFDEVFNAVKEYCRANLVVASYNLWIADIKPVSFDGEKAVLEMQSEFKYKTVSSRYLPLLTEAFTEILGFSVDIEFLCAEAEPVPVVKEPEAPAVDTPLDFNIPSGSYAFSFSKFVVGSNNKFAHAASQAVAQNPAKAYNPLFIYGDSGLGKTHLLNAIRLEIAANFKHFNIVYVDGESFANEIINAIHTNSTAAFHEKYRAADVLLVDDIQFIGGKTSTQEEFFHTFNTLYQNDKQIILASDRPPKEIKSLEDRLRTRFEWGLTADIQPPAFETRVVIVKRYAALLGLDLPDDVSKYIAENLKNNIRQLEGAVKKIHAYNLLENVKPSIPIAQLAIKDILNEKQPVPVTIEKIISEVARTFNVSVDDIKGQNRTSNLSSARRVSIYIIRQITGLSTLEIGKEFNRDHSTIVYTLKKMETELQKGGYIKETVEDIIKNSRT